MLSRNRTIKIQENKEDKGEIIVQDHVAGTAGKITTHTMHAGMVDPSSAPHVAWKVTKPNIAQPRTLAMGPHPVKLLFLVKINMN